MAEENETKEDFPTIFTSSDDDRTWAEAVRNPSV